ncbi:glycosyltransferase family 2 protein [Actomonas aquatica]|uniref:Glycosyltransferase family 2 protein n=1 Tax=Actomonas aquatica TaxID=2866162 RepID=A0ABZ1CAQ4_9BACT|nr:glycosyltransferase family 2 protein [Opitutus sp. WL0086]WRQ88472.1 glycosyltransferase family 2 protein [Opitutus sp. WL0086]
MGLPVNAPLPLSVLIPARNEEANLRDCIASCSVADDIVVVDSRSSDNTPAIARELGARVIDFDWNGRLPKKKNWALANVEWKHDWVFILDADERFTPELVEELRTILASPPENTPGYYVNRRFWFLDGWLKHCGYYPSWNLRLFRHNCGRYEQFTGVEDTGSGDNEVHEHVQLQGSAGYLKGELDHYAFPTIDIWVEKHNRYSSWEAQLDLSAAARAESTTGKLKTDIALKRVLRRISRRLPFRPTLRFVYHYLLRRGFLDGYRGWVFCRLLAFYEFLGVAKAAEYRRSRSSPPPS